MHPHYVPLRVFLAALDELDEQLHGFGGDGGGQVDLGVLAVGGFGDQLYRLTGAADRRGTFRDAC